MNKYTRIQYKNCKAFKDGKGGRLIQEIDKENKIVYCCGGALEDPTEWANICSECLECPKYINNNI